MIKLFLTLSTLFFVNCSLCQDRIGTTMSIKELGRTGTETSFQVIKDHNEYTLKFIKGGADNDSLYVFCMPKKVVILRTRIEILDTLELETRQFEDEQVVLIKTGGNLLLNHILKLKKTRAKLLERVRI